MPNGSIKKIYGIAEGKPTRVAGALKLGLIATASALAGGLAVAWWYRETLQKLQNPVNLENLQKSGGIGTKFPYIDRNDFEALEPKTLPHSIQD